MRDFQLYGSVQGSAVGEIQMKCIHDLDEVEKLAAEAVQLKPMISSPPRPPSHPPAAATAAAVPRSINGSVVTSMCKWFNTPYPIHRGWGIVFDRFVCFFVCLYLSLFLC